MTTLDFMVPANVATVERNVKRKPTVAGAVATINRKVDQRVGEAADELSRGAIIKSRLQLVEKCLADLMYLLYEVDGGGYPVNVDPATLRILVPLPWGAGGWKKWKLRQWEARILRNILDRRMRTSERIAMFWYSGESNNWHLNKRYDTPEKYRSYWQQQPITVAEWRVVER